MFTHLIDPPSPFSPTKDWTRFKESMQELALAGSDEAVEYVKLALSELRRREKLPPEEQRRLDN